MLSIFVVKNYLPETVRTSKHSSAVSFRELITSVATASGGNVSSFSFKNGNVRFTIDGDQAIDAVRKELQNCGDNVIVETLNPFQVQFEKNRQAEEKTRKMNATKKARSTSSVS